jgi:hypothetical protein
LAPNPVSVSRGDSYKFKNRKCLSNLNLLNHNRRHHTRIYFEIWFTSKSIQSKYSWL